VAVYVISDLHLDENEDARLFRDDWQGRALASLCEQIARDGAELVLLGDIFDLTAMTPPKKGLRHFFASLAVEAEPPPCRPVAALVRAGARANPHAIDALARLSERVRVTLVPGTTTTSLLPPKEERHSLRSGCASSGRDPSFGPSPDGPPSCSTATSTTRATLSRPAAAR